MWLPVILLRDFGPWSFPIFALPNVIGAALMGFALRRPGASEDFVRSHRLACHAFSFVTIAFQTFFLIWLLIGSGGSNLARVGLLAIFLLPAMLAGEGGAGSRRARAIGIAVYLLSLGAAGYWLLTGGPRAFTAQPPDAVNLGSLGAVCVLGFMLCPYLDLTFHRARQRLPGHAGNAAFVIGFTALFFLMILFTYFYAQPTLNDAGKFIPNPALAGLAVTIHMLAQLGFTNGLHNAALRDDATTPTPFTAMGGTGAIVLALLCFFLPDLIPAITREMVYRGFMGMYGLVFPAYVWACVRRDLSPPTRPQIIALAIAVLLAGPMFYLGFIEKRYGWLAAGVAVVLLSRVGTLTGPPRPSPRADEP